MRSLVLSVLLLAGCSGAGGEARAQAGQPKDAMMVCELERPTGSNIPQKVCRPAEPDEMLRARNQNELVGSQRNVQGLKGGGG